MDRTLGKGGEKRESVLVEKNCCHAKLYWCLDLRYDSPETDLKLCTYQGQRITVFSPFSPSYFAFICIMSHHHILFFDTVVLMSITTLFEGLCQANRTLVSKHCCCCFVNWLSFHKSVCSGCLKKKILLVCSAFVSI